MSFESLREQIQLEPDDWSSEEDKIFADNEAHDTLLRYVKSCVKESRNVVAKHYEQWDYNDLIFRSRRAVDKEDRAAVLKGNTAKMVVPLTYSQIMTWVAFCVMTVTQNKRFWVLDPTNQLANILREPLEQILERDVRRNQWNTWLIQYFLDIGKFSLGCAEVSYEEDVRYIRMPKTQQKSGPFGQPMQVSSNNYEPITMFLGNRVRPISPYRFFPDHRVSLERLQDGQYCASEEMWTMSKLYSSSLDLFNLDLIPKLSQKEFDVRKSISRVDEIPMRVNSNLGSGGSLSPDTYMKHGGVIITKGVYDIIPRDFEVRGKKILGKEKFPLRYIVWYANDKTVVRFEEASFLHGQFPYIGARYIPDQHHQINEGLADVCDQIQEYITWLVNTHKASQANSVESKWAVDPSGVDIKSLESRSPYIQLKRSAANMGVDRYIKQFKTEDVTAGTPQEIATFKELLESLTGLSGFMQGQSSPGRRSATQDQVVTQGASARGKTILGSIWDCSFVPLGRQLIANNRQDMDLETFQSIVGDNPVPELINQQTGMPWMVEEIFELFQGDPVKIATDENFFVFDNTLPAEKAYLAQSLQEIFMEMLQNPAIAQVMGYGPVQFRQLFEDIYTLRGVSTARLPAPIPPAPPAGAPGQQPPGPPGQPPQPAGGSLGFARGTETVPLIPGVGGTSSVS